MRNFQDTFETRKLSFISLLSICMTVPLNMLYVISASCSFSKTTSAYQIDILHPSLHSTFQAVAAYRQVNRQTDRQPARQTGRQAGRQTDRIDTQIYMCYVSLQRAVFLLFESLLAQCRFLQDQMKHETSKPPSKLELWLCSLKVVVPEPRHLNQQ